MMRYVLGLAVAAVLVTQCLLSAFVLSDRHLFMQHGWDARLYCEAAQEDAAGGNPYVSETFPFRLSWLYPPALLNVFRGACRAPVRFASVYAAIYAGVALGSAAIWRSEGDWLLSVAVAAGCFGGLAWSFLTGNLDALLLAPISLAFDAFRRARWHAAGAWLGIVAAIKILPLVYLPLLLLAPAPWRTRWRALATGAAVFFGVGALLIGSRSELAIWFFRQILGLIPGQQSPATEFGGFRQPAFPFLAAEIMGWPNNLTAVVPGMAVGVAVVGLLAVVARRAGAGGAKRQDGGLFLFALAFLAVHLVLPRFKPYSFILLTPALFQVIRVQRAAVQAGILTVTALYPAWALYVFLHRTVEAPLGIWMEYSQMIALLATIAAVVFAGGGAPAALPESGRAPVS